MDSRDVIPIAGEDYDAAHRGIMDDLRKGFDLGMRGQISWKRDSLHEREAEFDGAR